MSEINWDQITGFTKSVKMLYGPEVGVVISDLDKYLYYTPGSAIDLGIKANDPIREGSTAKRTLESKSRVVVKVDASLYGVAYFGIGAPIFDENDEVAGSIVIVSPANINEALTKNAARLEVAAEAISHTTSGLSGASQQLAASASNLSAQSHTIKNSVQKTDVVLNLIREVASQTHLLGLNAAIEAARAGDRGQGFTVVAEEIRKLARRTHVSIKEITDILEVIRTEGNSLSEQITQIAAVSEEQSASIEEVASSINEVAMMSKELNHIADQITS